MAQKTVKGNDGSSPFAPNRALVEQFNALLVKLDALGAKLNADAGVIDVNYATDHVATLKINLADG